MYENTYVNIRIYVYMYASMCKRNLVVCIYVYMYVCIKIRIYVYMYASMCKRVVDIEAQSNRHWYGRVKPHMYIHTYVCIYVQWKSKTTYVRTYIYVQGFYVSNFRTKPTQVVKSQNKAGMHTYVCDTSKQKRAI